MSNSVINEFYADSQEKVKVGDCILLDGHPGCVTGVYMPGTKLAEDVYCQDTGALAILFDDGTPTIYPFGNYHVIKKVSQETN